jgi:hypothetical protein
LALLELVRLRPAGSATEPEKEGNEQDRADDCDDDAGVREEEQQNDSEQDQHNRESEHVQVVPGPAGPLNVDDDEPAFRGVACDAA